MQIDQENNIQIIGQGAFGCVFTYQDQPDKIYKTFTKKITFNNEIQYIYFVQSHVDKNFQYTPIYYNSYTLRLKPNQFTKLFQDCNFKFQQQIYIIELENCGDSLSQLQIHSNQEFHDFLFSFQDILKGIDRFAGKKIIHNDIRPDNLVYNSQTQKSKIIDFSILIQLSSIKNQIIPEQLLHFFKRLPHWYFNYHPIEYMILSNAIFTINTTPVNVYNKYIEHINYYETPGELNSYLQIYILNKKQFIKQYQEIKNSIFQHGLYDFYDKIDIYGAGYTLLFMLIKYKNFISKNQFNLVLRFCQQIMDINYKKRLNPKQAIQHYQKLLQQLNFQQLKKKQIDKPVLNS